MLENKSQNLYPKKAILDGLIKIITDMTSEWERGFDNSSEDLIGLATRLFADLEFKSIDLARLALSIEKYFKRQELPFYQLFLSNESKIDDITVADLVDFLYVQLNSS
jgi:hypothetical protein